MKKLIKITSLFLSVLFLYGCVSGSGEVIYELDNSTVGETYEMKSDFINTKTVTLYFPDSGFTSLSRIVKEISVVQGGSEILSIARKLLNSTVTQEDSYVVPFYGTADVDWIVLSRNLATVNLEGDFSVFSEQEMFCGIVSLVNTLCELNAIDYVEILLNGKQFESRGLLVNPMSSIGSTLHLMYLDHINIIESEDRKITRNKNILYFLDTNSNFLIAEISNVAVSKEKAAEDLFKLLKNEPDYGSGIQSSIPQNVLMSSSAVISEEGDENVLTIRLEAPKYETMENKTRYMMCGSIVLTLLSYYETVSAVRILINGQPALEETLLTKDMFFDYIGQIVTVYLPDRYLDYLVQVDFAMSQSRYNSPEERVREIILADTDYKANTAEIISDDVTEEDILDVFVHDLCCVVSISENLYNKISVLPYKNRKMFVYSVVNTLTEFENVSSVQFLVEGKIYEKLGESLYIETPMLKNPGIVYD